jgi:urea transport system ATP-binding protein
MTVINTALLPKPKATKSAIAPATSEILRINNISVAFDGFYALTEVNIAVNRSTIHFFIGPNGAGKTTLLDIICGRTKSTSGTVFFYPQGREEVRLPSMKEYKIVNAGVGRKFQVPSVFINLTVWDNMVLSLPGNKGVMASMFHRLSSQEKDDIEQILTKFDLLDQRDAIAGALAHGQKQHLEIAMQMVGKPELIMLDEPAAGMGKRETFRLGQILQDIKKECTVIVVEHDMEFVKQIADVATVLHEGRVLIEGNITDVLADQTVQAVYLGRGAES